MCHIFANPQNDQRRTSPTCTQPFSGWKFLPVGILPWLLGLTMFSGSVLAQTGPLILDPTGRSGEPPAVTKPTPLPQKPPPEILPPPPVLKEETGPPPLRVYVDTIQIEGNTVFSQEELDQVTQPYRDRNLTTEDLEELRQALTLLYINKGYVSSGAIIPDQAVTDGRIVFRMVEGTLNDITVEGEEHFLPIYFSSRLALHAGPPVNLKNLRDQLQVMLQDPLIARLNAELRPGLERGQSVLHVRVEEKSPWRAWAEFNNYQSPTVGAARLLGTVGHQNLLGLRDSLFFTYGRSDGVDPLIDTSYTIPFTPWDTSLQVQYRRNDFQVVEEPFSTLKFESESEVFSGTLRQPLLRTPTQEVAVSFTGERLENQTFIDGFPLPFATPGADKKGRTVVTALRFGQEWTWRNPSYVLATRSRFSVGIDALNATANASTQVPDTHFFSWLGQMQLGYRWDVYPLQVISRMDLQLANDLLFPLEQYAVGGRYSVRGYRENTLVRDNAFLFTAESRIPLLPDMIGPDTLQLAPFVDVGRSWFAKRNKSSATPLPGAKTLASVGVGLRLNLFQNSFPAFNNLQANVYWGHQLNDVDQDGNNFQDHGVHVQVLLNVL